MKPLVVICFAAQVALLAMFVYVDADSAAPNYNWPPQPSSPPSSCFFTSPQCKKQEDCTALDKDLSCRVLVFGVCVKCKYDPFTQPSPPQYNKNIPPACPINRFCTTSSDCCPGEACEYLVGSYCLRSEDPNKCPPSPPKWW